MRTICLIGIFLLGMAMQPASAHDFTATVNGQKLYFNIIDKTAATAEVTYKGSISEQLAYEVEGEVGIPAKVKHENVVYRITAIGAKAFSGADRLTGVILPSTVTTIGDFAFEGCVNLRKVVFPGNAVTLGQGTFFKCCALRDLSFGSDWKTLDLTPYRWSDSLKVIAIPAKVEKVQNLKSLRALQRVEVDVNNPKFAAADGVLYNKDGKTLYGVPRGYRGMLKIKAGTETVTNGALIDCPEITAIVFPESLKACSFRETSRMSALSEVVFRSCEPLGTAYADGQGVFLLQVANPGVKIVVPKEAKKLYAQRLVVDPGDYAETETGVAYRVTGSELPAVKNISGIKNFDDYE